jgi:hypothetical protein
MTRPEFKMQLRTLQAQFPQWIASNKDLEALARAHATPTIMTVGELLGL